MKKVKKILAIVAIMMAYTTINAQTKDTIYFPHSLQLNVAGLSFERWALAYEWRITSRHSFFIQGGGSFPYLSQEKEYGLGLHYKYYLKPVREAKFLWLFSSAYKNSFVDFNARYMKLDGIYKQTRYLYEASVIGVGLGQTWVWNSGFTLSYWLGYGPPIISEFHWKNTVPIDGDNWAKMYKYGSGLDFGLSLGYSFGRS